MSVPVDVLIRGQALEDFGFTVELSLSGTGLNTFGFLWDCSAIWYPGDNPALTTAWTECTQPPGMYEICAE